MFVFSWGHLVFGELSCINEEAFSIYVGTCDTDKLHQKLKVDMVLYA